MEPSNQSAKKPKRPTFQVVAKIRLPEMTLEYKGTHSECCTLLFEALGSKPKTRQRLLAQMYQAHQRMSEHEAKAGAQTS